MEGFSLNDLLPGELLVTDRDRWAISQVFHMMSVEIGEIFQAQGFLVVDPELNPEGAFIAHPSDPRPYWANLTGSLN